MRKRMTSLLLTLVMLLSLVPAMGVTANAAEWTTVNSFEELHTAVKNKQQYIKLGRDIDTSSLHDGLAMNTSDLLDFKDQDFVLDLNGKTLHLEMKIANPYFIQVVSGSLTIKDNSTAKTGAITGLFGAVKGGWIDHLIFVGGNGSLTLEDGTFSVQGVPFSDVLNAVYCKNGNVTIKDGVKLSQPEFSDSGYAFDLDGNGYALCAELDKGSTGKVIIEGGEFDGCVKLTGSQAENGSVQINGGTFKKDVQVLYKAEKNNSDPAVAVNGGTFEGNVYLQGWDWKTSLYMPYRLNGGTFKGKLNLHADYKITAYDKPEGNPNIALGLDKCFGYSAVVAPDGTFTGPDAKTVVLKKTTDWDYEMLLNDSASNPVRIIPNAWGMMESVTLDGDEINYAKDWYGAAVEITNDTAHTIKFEWNRLAQELKDAKYSYDAKCEHYVSGSTAVEETENIAANATSHTITIEKGADPKVYSFDLKLNLEKNGSLVGIVHNQHIVKLVVKPAPVVKPDPTLDGTVYYTSGIVFGNSISTATSGIPADATPAYQWQRSTDGGDTWTDIEGATSGKYTPVAADMGDTVRIRVKVTAEGYLGEIVGAPLKVNKADNNNYPEVIQLEAVKDSEGHYIGFEITNFDSDCEYVYSETSEPDWSKNKINSATETGLASDKTYYVFARFEETKTHTVGSIVSRNSIGLFDKVPLQYVLLEGYVSGEKIYIKKGESVELKVSADPINANYWNKITFEDEGATTSNIEIESAEIPANDENAASFPKHSITIKGVSKGSANLKASYPGPSNAYGTWHVVVYDDPADALRLENVYTYADITLSKNDEAELPTDLPKLLPEDSGYHLEWRIIKTYGTGFEHLMEDANIKLEEDGKIKPKAAHTGGEKTLLGLVAIDKTDSTIRSLSPTSRFYVTVTEAPTIDLIDLTVAPAMVNLEIGKDIQLSAVKQPANAPGTLTWSSDNTAVAEVDNAGKVTAKAQGTAIITVTCGTEPDTKSATCTVLVDHKHSYSDQPYLYLDPGNHYQECVANDGSYNIEAHDFNAWTKDNETTHSRTCSKCTKSGETAHYTETAEHTWVWVVDQEAALNQPGLQHEECTGCHAKRHENTEIPALQDYAVTVTGGTATVAAGTITRAMEGVEVTVTAKAPAGKHFVKWVVKAGGVTLANETSATTTFIMPAEDVEIEANFEKNASTGTGTGATTYPITVMDSKNGDVTASHKPASKGTTVTLTVDPDKGYVLDTLTVLDGKDKELKLTEKNGKYTFTMPDSKVTVAATFKASAPTGKNPFIDVPAGSYYEDAVIWAVDKGITTGMSAAAFDPNGSCTRAQIVTFLWRAAGSPEPKTMKGFDDVASNAYYAKAVAWAVENGITTGTSASKFSPNDPCTRTQAVTFLFRYAAANGMEAVTMQELLSGYADAASVPSYAVSAMNWALAAGILQGDGVKLMPNATCTRAQIVTFIYRSVK